MKNRNLDHNDDWATPQDFYSKLNDEFDFDFDPCPLSHSRDEWDGLEVEWGQRNFVNPPYSQKLKEAFIRKSFEESRKGKLCVLLLPVSTSTKIFHEVIYPNAQLRFVKGRIHFEGVNTFGVKVGKGSSPMHDSMIVIFDNHKRLRSKTRGVKSHLTGKPTYGHTTNEAL